MSSTAYLAGRHVTRVQAAAPAITHHSWDRDLADTAQPEEVGDSWKEMSSTYLSTVYMVTSDHATVAG